MYHLYLVSVASLYAPLHTLTITLTIKISGLRFAVSEGRA